MNFDYVCDLHVDLDLDIKLFNMLEIYHLINILIFHWEYDIINSK